MRVGIVGGGQLGRMLAMAGHDLGLACTSLDPAKDSPASQVAPALVGAYDDREALLELAARSDVVTYEFENVPTASVSFLEERGLPVSPPSPRSRPRRIAWSRRRCSPRSGSRCRRTRPSTTKAPCSTRSRRWGFPPC